MAVVRAEMAATVWAVKVAVGDVVEVGHELIILESMKMEIPVVAPAAGTVLSIAVHPGDPVMEDDVLAEIG